MRSRSLQRRALRADDLAEVDDLLLDVGDVADDLRRAALEDVLLEALELVAHLAQHREGGVDAVVDDLVEQVAGALGEQLLAELLRRAAALEEVLERRHRLVGQRDDVVRADEEVDLGRVQAPDGLVEGGEVQDDEEVVVVLVDLRALVAREDVLVVERVEVEVLLQPGAVGLARALDVDPAQAAGDPAGGLDDLDVGALRLAGACGDRAAGARTTGRTGAWAGSARGLGGSSVAGTVSTGCHLVFQCTRVLGCPAHIAGRIQRGGGTGPMKPRQPSRASGNGANS